MKKYITIAALLAAGSSLASANIDTSQWDTLTYTLVSNTSGTISQNHLDSGRAGFKELNLNGETLSGISGTDYSWSVSFKLGEALTSVPASGHLLFSTKGGNNGSGICIGLDSVTGDNYTFALRHGIPTQVYASKTRLKTFTGSFDDTLSLSWDAATKNLYFEVGTQSYNYQIQTPVDIVLSTEAISTVADGTTFWTNSGHEKLTDITVKAHAIPEPSTFGLLAGIGALALVGTRRRKRA